MKYWKLLLIASAALNCFSCSQNGQEAKNILRMYLGVDPLSLDPRIAGTLEPQIVIGMLFEGLIRLDRDGNPEPGIAESYEMADDYMSCTFHLRETQWSNGETLTAHDFANAWREALEPSFDSNHAYAFYPLKNAKAAKEGKLPIEQVGVRALDDRTLFVAFEYPAPFFIELAANPIYSPVYLKKPSQDFVSNGPFILKNRKYNDHLHIEKNEKYWDAKSINIDGISIAIVPDSNTALLMYEQDQLDIIGNPMSDLPLDAALKMDEQGMLHKAATSGLCWLVFNTEHPPFNSAKVRKAFSYAVDREEIVTHLTQGGESPSTSILPKNLLLQDLPYFTDGNVEEARRLLAEGLQELGMTKESMPKIQLRFTQRWNSKSIAQVIQQQWKRGLEIPVELLMTERSVYSSVNMNSNYQVSCTCWNSWLSDPSYNLGHIKTKNRVNVSHWENMKYKELIELAENERNIEQRRNYYHQAEKVLMEEMPIAPLFCLVHKYAKKDGIEGICFSKCGRIDLKWVVKQNP